MKKMSNHMWKIYQLSEIGEIVGGATPSTAKSEYYGGDIPWLTPKDLSNFSGRYIERGERNITEAGLKSCSAKLLPAGTVLFSSRAPIGYVAIAKTQIATNQGFKSIIPNTDIVDSLFLYYLLCFNKVRIESMGSGTTFKEVSGSTMKGIQVSIPNLPEQRRIAGILGALDDKIELNRRINANLEAQAMTLYKQWFVDGRQEDWVEKKLGDIVDTYDYLRKPLSGQQREKMAKIYPYYGAASLMDYVENYIFDGIYLLLGEDGTVSDENGCPSLQYVWSKFWVNNHAHVLTGKNGYSTEMLYILLKQTNIHSIITGAVQPKINQANLLNLPVVCPPKDILNKYNEIIQPLFTQLRINSEQIKNLSTLRDTLLPKLMKEKKYKPNKIQCYE